MLRCATLSTVVPSVGACVRARLVLLCAHAIGQGSTTQPCRHHSLVLRLKRASRLSTSVTQWTRGLPQYTVCDHFVSERTPTLGGATWPPRRAAPASHDASRLATTCISVQRHAVANAERRPPAERGVSRGRHGRTTTCLDLVVPRACSKSHERATRD